jgi:hypothetical protein
MPEAYSWQFHKPSPQIATNLILQTNKILGSPDLKNAIDLESTEGRGQLRR